MTDKERAYLAGLLSVTLTFVFTTTNNSPLKPYAPCTPTITKVVDRL